MITTQQSLYDVSIFYTHIGSKTKRKRNRAVYNTSYYVKASSVSTSFAQATRIFLKMYPRTKIVEINASTLQLAT